MPQSQLEYGELEKTVLELFQNPEKIQTMEEYSIQMAAPDATQNIINTILEIAES
jgi:UDP-N-acetylglucosamine:LPS N-acetylglucosamine transferase